MKVNVGLLLDLGNSETRVQVMAWKKAYRFRLSNKFAVLKPGTPISTKYTTGNSTVLEHNGLYVANGELVDMEYATEFTRPDGLRNKTEQTVTEYSIKLAMYKALSLLSKELKQPIEQLDVSFKISILLPPIEHDTHEDDLASKIKNFSNVHVVIPEAFNKQFTISEVSIYPEGVASFFGAFYKEVGNSHKALETPYYDEVNETFVLDNGDHVSLAEVEDNKKFENGLVLVLDIGEGTTDMIIFKNMEFIERSKETLNRGGRAVASRIAALIRRKYSFAPSDERVMQRVISEGLLEEGSRVHDVAPILDEAKSEYAREMMNEINNYLATQSMSPREFSGLLVTGGGALSSVRLGNDGSYEVVSHSMSKYLIDHIGQLAPNIELVNTFGKDLRMLNLDGLVAIHKYQ